MFKQQKGKNAFLQKKNQEKAKAAEQQKQKAAVYKLQKHIRAHLARRRMITHATPQERIKLALIMKVNLHQFSQIEIQQFARFMMNQPKNTQLYYLKEMIVNNMTLPNCESVCQALINQHSNQQLRDVVMKRKEFPNIVSRMFEQHKATQLMNLSAASLLKNGILTKIEGRILLNAVLFQFREDPMVLENASVLSKDSIATIVEILFERNQPIKEAHLGQFSKLIIFYLSRVANAMCSQKVQSILCYLLQEFLKLGVRKHDEVAQRLIKENQNIISMIDDQQMMEEMEQKLRQNELMEDFTNQFLNYIRNIVNHEIIVAYFERGHYKHLNAVLLKIVNELSVLFQDRKLIFIRSIISSDSLLKTLSQSKDPMFRQGLKMRLLPMDDPEFKNFNIFTEKQWITIIKGCVQVANIKIQKMLQKYGNQPKEKLLPFKRRNRDELQFKTVVDLLSNLYKKVYRTGKFNPEVFVDYGLSNQLTNFLFGKGARKIEIFLKQFPYLFSFQSRMSKFKEFIKTDKLNYDRTLFLQEEVDEDLIIAVRRGHQFMDAFQACMTRDLRKKYKIIFFNQQGLEQEGVDGGGIIKQFINRVLRSAFSQTYSLFMETPLNQILPNPYSISTAEYEFVGKLVGKAVYEGINIEQKFAEPFLNLLIGRQNTFEDLQFIDPSIYNSLLSLKNTTEDISELQQTFVIYDSLPNGINKYINLLCPSKPPNQKHVFVTNQNKMDFIMSYADFKCNKQIQQKTRLFRKGFLKVMKPQWLTMFSNQQLNLIISGANPDFNVDQMRLNTVYKDYHEKDETIIYFWQVVRQMTCEQKSQLLLYITSCSRPPTLGFEAMKPRLCISFDNDATHLPTANTCMNVLRLPNYKNKALLKKKLLYAITSKAGFQFA